jgi:hypothetical protein
MTESGDLSSSANSFFGSLDADSFTATIDPWLDWQASDWVNTAPTVGSAGAPDSVLALGTADLGSADYVGRVSSSAYSFSGILDVDNSDPTTFNPFDPVSGSAPPLYDHEVTTASFDQTYDLNPSQSHHLTLDWQASDVVNTALAEPFTNEPDVLGGIGKATFGSADFQLMDNLRTALSVEATGIVSVTDSVSTKLGSSTQQVGGGASFDSLTITGTLVNDETLTFSGSVGHPDTVLYHTPEVTITLDHQTAGSATEITTDAIYIQLNNAVWRTGYTVTGNFEIGQSSASYAPMSSSALAHS